MPQKIIGVAVAIFGLVGLSLMLFLLVTQPLIKGDPDGTMTKAVLCGVVGFFGVAGGYSIVSDESKKSGKNETDGKSESDEK